MEKNSEVCQNSTSFQQKEAVNSDVVVRNAVESIINDVVNLSSSLIEKDYESNLARSVAGTSGERSVLKNEHESRHITRKLEILPSKEFQLKSNISIEDFKESEDSNAFEKTRKISNGIMEDRASEKRATLMRDQENLSINLSKLESEEKAPLPERKANENNGIEKIYDRVKNGKLANENLKEFNSRECNQSKELSFKTDSDAIKNHALVDISEMEEEPVENSVLPEEKNENKKPIMPNEDAAFSNYLDITIPRVGKHVFQNEEGPLRNCYDLAIERNERRFNYMRETGIDDEVLRLVDEEANMSESDKKKKKKMKQQENIEKACYVTELCAKILEELVIERPNENKIIYYLMKFLDANVTPTCLLYVPHLVHTIAFIRGRNIFKKATRLAADECYNYCHAMFPIPFGYNFETVYTSEMRKFLPDDFDKMENMPLDYGGIDDILEDSDDDCNAEDDEDNSDNYSLL